MTLRERVVEIAMMYENVRFHHAGRDANGVDCVGLLVRAAEEAGIEVIDDRSYSPVINAEYMMFRLNQMCRHRLPGEPIQLGDVLAFKVGKSIQHVGLITQVAPMRVIHAHQGVGRVVEHELDQKWLACIAGVYTLKAYDEEN